ncbi:MAG TPA: hypothetical protein VGL23_17000, partial [Chloroflexota bacterium]
VSTDIYRRLGIARVINASGRMTNLGGSHLADGDPPIYLRAHHAGEGYVAVDPRPIDDNDARMIVARIRAWASS